VQKNTLRVKILITKLVVALCTDRIKGVEILFLFISTANKCVLSISLRLLFVFGLVQFIRLLGNIFIVFSNSEKHLVNQELPTASGLAPVFY